MKRVAILFALVAPISLTLHEGLPQQQATSVLDTLLARLDNTDKAAAVGSSSSCAAWSSTLGRLCEGVYGLRLAELSGDVKDVASARDILERVVQEQPKWPLGWYALGRLRMKASQIGMVGREGPLQMEAQLNSEGAARAFDRAVELDYTFSPALEYLARAMVPFTDKILLKSRVTTLRKSRRYLSGGALVAEALLELDAGFPDTAVNILKPMLLVNGIPLPRGEAQITLARAYYRVGRGIEGRKALFAGASETDSSGIAAYREQISWVGDSAEMKEWDALAPVQRPGWLGAFWGRRDVREGRKDGERLVEHYRRVNIAFERYRMTAPVNGEQRMVASPEEATFARELVTLARQLEGKFVLQPDTVQMVHEYLQARSSLGAQSPHRVFNSHQTTLDDRGLMYIRYGEPNDRVTATPGYISIPDPNSTHDSMVGARVIGTDSIAHDSVKVRAPSSPMEIWKYNRPAPNSPMFLYFVNVPFQGSSEPNVLVPTLLAEDPATRQKLCVIDARLCPRTGDLFHEIAMGEMRMDRISLARQRGLDAIAEAVTSDAFPREFAKPLHPYVQMHLLERALGGMPRVVVAFSLPGQEISSGEVPAKKDATTGPVVYPISMQISAARTSDGKRVSIDSSRKYTMQRQLTKGQYLSGFVEIPLEVGNWETSIAISQPGGAGAIVTTSEISVRDWRTQVRVSDLVLGRDESGLKWHSGVGGQPVPLNPLNTFPPGSSATVYAQIAGLNPGELYHATIELFEGREAAGKPALIIGFDGEPDAERVEFSKILSLNALAPGRYVVQLTLTSRGEKVVTKSGLSIVK